MQSFIFILEYTQQINSKLIKNEMHKILDDMYFRLKYTFSYSYSV